MLRSSAMTAGLRPLRGRAGRNTNLSYQRPNSIGKDSKKLCFRLIPWMLLSMFGVYVLVVIRWYHQAPFIKRSSQVSSTSQQEAKCSYRKYPPHRYFHRKENPLPTFLTETEYIYGEFPTLFNLPPPASPSGAQKLCVDQSPWLDPSENASLPFADGTNPSIIRIKVNPRLDLSHVQWKHGQEAFYLATICMTNSQCAWNDTPQQIQEYRISTLEKPTTVRTVLAVLDQNFKVLEETTIKTLIDAPFGRRIKPKNPPETRTFALDDARLFTCQNELWVAYREGPHFGYDKEVLNRVHLGRKAASDGGGLQATLKASESETLCCGRNMALLDNFHTGQLEAVTWVDPMTVETVKLKNTSKRGHRRSLLDTRRQTVLTIADSISRLQQDSSEQHAVLPMNHRRLSDVSKKQRKSDFHGTNGFMVHLPATQEYLGIGHFHRPPGRDENPYARFGHHYTHAFYTIPDQPPFRLKRLSPELLLPSYSNPDDAEIIQFWSGLELVDGKTLALAYGINDCEGAAVYIDLERVDKLLRDVPPGNEVIDLLKPVSKDSMT